MAKFGRRRFLVATGGLLAAPLARAQQHGKARRVGLLVTNMQGSRYIDALKDGLRERGWIEGKNYVLDLRSAEGDVDLFQQLAAELVAAGPDVIVATTYLAVLAVTFETDSIPVLFAAISDPVKAGLVESLARPGGQLTGVAIGAAPLAEKRIEILKEALPQLKRLAVLYDSGRQGDAGLARIRDGATRLGVALIEVGAGSGDEIERAFEAFRARDAEALLVPGSIRFFIERNRIIALALRYRLPAMYEFLQWADQGGLIAYGPDYEAGYRRLAYYVDRILRGTPPGDLPIEMPMHYRLVVNLKTARSLGITISQNTLLRADRVIE